MFSLASIATLYILEYHRRHTNNHPSLLPNHNQGQTYFTNNFNHVNINSNTRPPNLQSTHDPQSTFDKGTQHTGESLSFDRIFLISFLIE